MIIGINGYIGSGKDTVGTIIQYLTTKKKDISYSGSYNSFIMDVGMGSEPEWKIKKFAYKLKQIASILTGIPIEKFEDQEFKKTYLPKEWNYLHSHHRTMPEEEFQMTVREFLQRLGTEGVRDGVHKQAWVNALFADYRPIRMSDFGKNAGATYPNWIVTDTRFPNEAQAVKDRKGIVIRVERRRFEDTPYETLEQRHPSETSLDDWKFDYTINNNGTIEKLIEKVRIMREELQLW